MRLILLICFVSASVWATTAAQFGEVHRYPLGGDGGWDYLTADASTKRLYISRAQRVWVVDTVSGKLLHEIPGTEGVHGIALAPALGIGFTSNGKAATVSYFNLRTYQILGQIPVGQGPDAILYEPVNQRVYAFNGKSHDVSVIDAKTKKVIATIPLPGKPESVTSDEKGAVFVDIEDKNLVAKLNVKKMNVEATFRLDPCDSPTGLAIDAKRARLFVGCGNKLMAVVDSHSGKLLKTFPVGSGVDAAAFDPNHNLVFVSAGEGKLSAFRETDAGVEFIEDVPTQKGARTLAVDSESGHVFLVTAKFGESTGKGRPPILPDTFVLLEIGPGK